MFNTQALTVLYWIAQVICTGIIIYLASIGSGGTFLVIYFSLLLFLVLYRYYKFYKSTKSPNLIERVVFDCCTLLYWSLYILLFIGCYTGIGYPRRLDMGIIYYLIGGFILGILLSRVFMNKHLWLYILIVLIGLHIYMSNAGYVFNITHQDYWH